MSSLVKRSKSIPPVKLTWRGRLALRYARWRGPVEASRTGVAVIRHRRELRVARRVITVVSALLLIGGVAAAIKRQGDISPVT